MATIKSYTDINQSKVLAEILPLESADMYYSVKDTLHAETLYCPCDEESFKLYNHIPCWSLAALLKYLSGIKPQVYIPLLFPSEGKWMLQFVEYGHGNVCEVSCDNPIDACYEMILKLHEEKIL